MKGPAGKQMGISGGRVLVAEGDSRVRGRVCSYLRADGFQVLEASSGLEALLVLRRGTVDIALIDPMLAEAARIAELDAGADDYVAGALSMPEVTARMRAQLRRARGFGTEPTVLHTGALTLDLEARRCTVSGSEVELTRREFDLLAALLRYPGRIHTREQLLELVWANDAISPKAVDGQVAALRRKLGTAISIATLRGHGYRLDPVSEPRLDASDVALT